jgi:hypothetical protein
MPHLFIFAFAFLLVAAMELTWPVKGKSFVQIAGVECATAKAATEEISKQTVFEEKVEEEKTYVGL